MSLPSYGGWLVPGRNFECAVFLTALGLCYSLNYGQINGIISSLCQVRILGLQRISPGSERLGCGLSVKKFAMPEIDHDFVEKILAGDRRAIARAISSVENRDPSAVPLLRELFPKAGRARVVGITGSPGAGKSTLVEKLAEEYRRRGGRVGILAVDPTSPFSGGAILGDRVRMQSLANDPGVYIRSMATRGQLGGLAPTTQDAVTDSRRRGLRNHSDRNRRRGAGRSGSGTPCGRDGAPAGAGLGR